MTFLNIRKVKCVSRWFNFETHRTAFLQSLFVFIAQHQNSHNIIIPSHK